MARKRRYKKRRGSPLKLKLRKDTIYTIFAIGMFLTGVALLYSYSQSGPTLVTLNEYLAYLFGGFGILVPFCLILLALLFTRIKSRFTKPNVAVGFLVFTLSIIGLFQSGYVGLILSSNATSLFSGGLAVLAFFAGTLIGLIMLFNLSLPKLFKIVSVSGPAFSGLGHKLAPLFRTKKSAVDSMQQITIKGLKDQPVSQAIEPAKNMRLLDKKGAKLEELILNKPLEIGVWEYPPYSLLTVPPDKKRDSGDVKKTASIIEKTLQSFGIQARVVEINVGPSVTQYALEIALGTKVSKITNLANDLALATEAPTGQIRIEAPIPGRNLVGIEIPNRSLEIVPLKRMLESKAMEEAKSKLTVPLGLDVSGNPILADLSKMPHILIAGTTGSGKSVIISSFITSLLFRASPSEVKMIMIDPKRVELTGYSGIPHLLTPVVVEADKSVSALKWALKEMDRRYITFSESGVRNIDAYNELSGFQALPYIVIFIDELADLMSLAPVEVEDSIARLAQMARATGIHLVLATQRPSVDVITGLIKANIPCRVAFNVSSMIDSKVIIDMPGAEKLLGRGDMLYVPPEQAKPTRIQGTFVSDQDVKRVVNFIKSRGVPVEYTSEVIEQSVNIKGRGGSGDSGARDDFFEEAVRIVSQYDKASSSFLQRRLQIGFNRAARLLEQLEEAGVVGPPDGSKPREVLVRNPDEFLGQSQG